MPSGTYDRPTKATKPLTGIVPVIPPSRQRDPRVAAVDCATLRVLRFCRTTHASKRAGFPDIDLRKADPRERYNDRPAYRAQYDNRITGRDPADGR